MAWWGRTAARKLQQVSAAASFEDIDARPERSRSPEIVALIDDAIKFF